MTTTVGRSSTTFDPLSPEFAQDPYPAYATLRRRDGFQYFEPYDMWLVARHADTTALVTNKKMVRSLDFLLSKTEVEERLRRDNWHDMPYHSRFVQFSMLDSDGPVHDRLRKLVFAAFAPSSIKPLRETVQDLVSGLAEAMATEIQNHDEFEFVEGFAAKVPGRTIGALFGAPGEDSDKLRRWSEDIVQFFDLDRSDERKSLAEQTTFRFYKYLLDLAARKRVEPGNDLMTKLVELFDSGAMNEDEFISTCMLIVMAGHGSTLDALGSGLHSLMRFPEQQQRLRDSFELMGTAVQEMFRFESPLPFFHRYATEEISFHGQQFQPGTRFGLLYGSANRDDAVFADADFFDVGRRPNRHQAFGGGAHFCLGNHLAKLSMETVFATLLQRFKRMELVGKEPEYKRGLAVRGPKTLHITAELA